MSRGWHLIADGNGANATPQHANERGTRTFSKATSCNTGIVYNGGRTMNRRFLAQFTDKHE